MDEMENVDLSDIPASSKATTPTDPFDQTDDQSTHDGLAPANTAIPLWAISSEIHGVMKVKETADWQKNLVDDLADSTAKAEDNMRLFCIRWGIHMGIISVIALILLIYFSFVSPTSPVVTISSVSKDCYDVYYQESEVFNGIYTIFPQNESSFRVYCDMVTDGGGWTIFQRRVDHGLVFWNKSWIEYKDGFGNGMDRDYWLGLDRLHMLTNKDENVTLRIDIWGDRCILEQTISKNSELRNCSQTENGYWFREWTFQVGNESDGYLLTLRRRNTGNLTSDNESDYFQSLDKTLFSTIDNDNDMESDKNCALDEKLGGWWHRNCTSSSLNGDYYIDDFGHSGFRWRQRQADGTFAWIYPLMSEMKLRKVNIDSPSQEIDLFA